MKSGKVSEAVLDRSVLRPLRMEGVLAKEGAAFGEDCAVLCGDAGFGEDCAVLCGGAAFGEDRPVLCGGTSSDGAETAGRWLSATVSGTVGGISDRTAEMLVLGAANNLAASGGRMKQVVVDILFPAKDAEEGLKALVQEIAGACRKHRITVCGGHTEASGAVLRPVVSVTGFAYVTESDYRAAAGLRPDQDLVMTGWTGMAGSAVLAANMEEELLKRYPFVLVDAGKALAGHLSVQKAARTGLQFGVSAMHDVSQGGVFGALWELAERAGVGLDIDLKKIPIRQETIEICEFFALNPYQLYGQGALLLGTDRGEELVSCMNAQGISAAVIGRAAGGKGRVIRSGEDERYLDRPAQDELWRWNHENV